jgi:hypothetical protein
MIKNIKLRKNKEYDIEHLTEDNFWTRKEPRYVMLQINIRNNTFKYIDCLNQQLYHIRKINYLRRIILWKIQVKKYLYDIYPLNIDLIQHLIFQFMSYPYPYFNSELDASTPVTYLGEYIVPREM